MKDISSIDEGMGTKILIDPRSFVSPNAVIGPGCSISGGAVVGAGVTLGRDVQVGPNVVFVEPVQNGTEVPATAGDRVRIGANSVICAGVVLAAGCLVRPGTVVTRSVPPGAIVEGNPASIVGYVDAAQGDFSAAPLHNGIARPVEATSVRGVKLYHFPVIPDLRGSLTVGEFDKQIPFTPLRYFMVFGVPSREIRGEHAHRTCHQFLICVRGNCAVVADDGARRVEVALDAPHKGLYLPPMTWGVQYKYSPDALLLVFASHHYDSADYIRNYAEFIELISRT